MIDLAPAADRMSALLARIGEEDFARPTPCPGTQLGDLIDHVGSLSRAFTEAAHKRPADAPPEPPSAENLTGDWQREITQRLATLVEAWRDPDAWEGTTQIAGNELPAEATGLTVLDELVVHGWDIAVASGQSYEPADAEIEAARGFVTSFDAPRDGSLFGPIVPVPDDAPALDRLLGLAGRDPHWRPEQGRDTFQR
jgi:uncharacterized protein (TIGR03086 family)